MVILFVLSELYGLMNPVDRFSSAMISFFFSSVSPATVSSAVLHSLSVCCPDMLAPASRVISLAISIDGLLASILIVLPPMLILTAVVPPPVFVFSVLLALAFSFFSPVCVHVLHKTIF